MEDEGLKRWISVDNQGVKRSFECELELETLLNVRLESKR